VTLEARLFLAAGILFAAFLLLGSYVTHRVPTHLDLAAASLRGTGVPFAGAFTRTGRAAALIAISCAVGLAFLIARWPLWIPIVVFASQLLSQAAVNGFKKLFHRVRPDDWLWHHELGFSYPSGHAATSITFFGMWAVVLMLSPAPRIAKVVGVVLLALWMLGIDWSRISLAAHYATDVIGGTLFGCAWGCLVLGVVLQIRGTLA
jgi:undecaprenyl-diphosphatase